MITRELRVLVVDDTIVYRTILKDVLEKVDGLQLAGTAPNGRIALTKVPILKPDLITLDIEMPEMNGLETLRQLKTDFPEIPVLMVSAHTTRDAEITLSALELGAFDFITKPDAGNYQENTRLLVEQFRSTLAALMRHRNLKPATTRLPEKETITAPAIVKHDPVRPDIIAIGISTGGPVALAVLIPELPANLPVPVVIVQHMPPVFTRALAESLHKKSKLTVLEGEQGMAVKPGHVYIAPGGKQMKVQKQADGLAQLLLTDDPAENYCKPSADYLFRSVAQIYGKRALGIIMTGMGSDGVIGLRLMKRTGASVYAQDEQSSVIFGMPQEAIKAGVVDRVLPLTGIAPQISRIFNPAKDRE